jgi:hypothetical protein
MRRPLQRRFGMEIFMKKSGLAELKEVAEEITESEDETLDGGRFGMAWKSVLTIAVALAAILIIYLTAVRKAPAPAAGGTGEKLQDSIQTVENAGELDTTEL